MNFYSLIPICVNIIHVRINKVIFYPFILKYLYNDSCGPHTVYVFFGKSV